MSDRSVIRRVAQWSYRHRWPALMAWVVLFVGVGLAGQAVGAAYRNDFSLPGTESQQALDVLRHHSPVQAGATVQVVLRHPDGLESAGTRAKVEAMLDTLGTLPHVAATQSPYDDRFAISADGTIGYGAVLLDGQATDVPAESIRTIVDSARSAAGAGLRVELGGDAVTGAETAEGGPAEGVGLLAALVILVLLFGSLRAAAMPLVIAIFAVGTSIGLVALASHVATVADYTTPLMVLVGLGVGIDYALLLLTRYRAEVLAGAGRERAVAVALATAGRTVVFAGCTVIIALLGLIAIGLGSLQGVAVAVAVTVLVTMIGALTLLPALLSLFAGGIDRSMRRRAQRAGGSGTVAEGDRWRRWSAVVGRHPWVAATLGLVAMLALAAPALGLRLGFADAGNGGDDRTSRRAYDLLAAGFGPGFNGPLIVVAQGGGAQIGEPLRRALEAAPGVAATTPAAPSADGTATTVIVFPAAKPQDEQTQDLVRRLRTDVLPEVARSTGATLLVGGTTAATVDFADAVSGRLALFVLVVVGLSSVLLLLVFRSVPIAVKAAVLNLLSVGASLGVVTLVFQHGFLGGLLGVEPGPIEAFVPVMIFAIAFGLSMDYEVFLLSRMHEEWERTGDAHRAVNEGLGTTGRVVTAAAAIMVVVFGSFLLDPGRMLKQFGLGLAVAVLLDALVIRCLLLPAVMHLLGPRAWWAPGWMGRRLPRLDVEPKPLELDEVAR